MSAFLAIANDMLQAIIVIFGVAVLLYNLPYVRRDRILRTFSLVLAAVVLVLATELLVSRTALGGSAQNWLYFMWLGISFVPAVQFHFSDALLQTTGSSSRRRMRITILSYLLGAAVWLSVLFTRLVTTEPTELPNAIYLRAGPLYWLFAVYYWSISIASIYNVWRAYKRCITGSTRRRMRNILLAIMAAPLSVFPYLAAGDRGLTEVPAWMWLLLIVGNGVVGLMFAQLTANIVYLGSMSSARVVRVRLLKFMARVPMTASIVLLVYLLTVRTSSFLGLDPITASAMTVVAALMLVEWAIHAYKGPIERVLHFNNEPDVRRIQDLSERLITRQDLRQFLESLLAAGCEALRAPAAFVTAVSPDGPQIAALVGRAEILPDNADELDDLPAPEDLRNGEPELIHWRNFRLRPLYTRQDEVLVGVLGVAVAESDDTWSNDELAVLERIGAQAAAALEDQLLQQSIFAAVEGLLPAITALQELRGAAQFSGAMLLADEDDTEHSYTVNSELLEDPEFAGLVKDALNHYWGGPKLTESPLLNLLVVQQAADEHNGNRIKGLRAVLKKAIDQQRPEGEQSLTRTEWLLYNILELKFVQGNKVADIARRLAMSESDLYRKQRVAIENVARTIARMEQQNGEDPALDVSSP